ncbi:MAG: M61 family metallopeptidase [Gemmatimonadaceae bacterium]
MIRTSRVPATLVLLALPALAAAQPGGSSTAARSAPIANVGYTVRIDQASAARRLIHVEMRFDASGAAPILLSLPAWTPGAYEISNFARWVTGFSAARGARALDWDKLDPDTWRIRDAGPGPVVVRFDYRADSLDNAMAWTKPDFALFNGTNLFLYPEGGPLDYPATVTVQTDVAWRVVTGMHATGVNRFSATNYHDLVDMPFFVGMFDVDSQQVSGKWTRLATYPAGSLAGSARAEVWSQLQQVIPSEVAVFGEAPWEHYTVMQIADPSYGGASGLEHQNSHVDVITPAAIGSEFMPSLYAHEIFHAFNVKRLRPAGLWPYAYDRPQPTTLLWMSEGITDYYADLAMVRGKVVNADGFYMLTSGKIGEVQSAPAVALEDASLSTWIHPVDGTGYIYYPKGSLAGFLLDIMIRDASDNRRGLDDVMRALYESTSKRGRGFTESEWWAAVSRAANGRSFEEFRRRYIDGLDPFPWGEVLPLAGLRGEVHRVPRIGVSSLQDRTGAVRVTELAPGGAAEVAGVQVGDALVSIGGVRVDHQEFGEAFRARYAAQAEGSPLPIVVRRGAQALTLQATLRFGEGGLRVREDSNAPAKAVRIRTGILTGR